MKQRLIRSVARLLLRPNLTLPSHRFPALARPALPYLPFLSGRRLPSLCPRFSYYFEVIAIIGFVRRLLKFGFCDPLEICGKFDPTFYEFLERFVCVCFLPLFTAVFRALRDPSWAYLFMRYMRH